MRRRDAIRCVRIVPLRLLALTWAILVAACTQPSGVNSPSPTPSSTARATASSTAAGAAFIDLVRAGMQGSFKINYRFTASALGQTTSVDQTWYVKGSQMRWDLNSPLGPSSSFFFLSEGVFLCVPEGEPSCLKLSSEQQARQNLAVLLQDQVWATPERFEAQSLAPRTVAGVQTQCFSIADKGSSSMGSGTQCYSAQGLPLYTQFSAPTGEFTLEATSVGSPTDDDLKLYAPVRMAP
jgi:hypothetical protein